MSAACAPITPSSHAWLELACLTLLLAFVAMAGGTAADQTVYSLARLAGMIPSQEQVAKALLGHGRTLVLVSAMDLPQTTDPAGAGRSFTGADG